MDTIKRNEATVDVHAIRRWIFIQDQLRTARFRTGDELSLRAENARRGMRFIANVAEIHGGQPEVLNEDLAALMHVFSNYLDPDAAEAVGEESSLVNEAAEFFANLFFHADAPTFDYCYRELAKAAATNGWQLRDEYGLSLDVKRVMEVTS